MNPTEEQRKAIERMALSPDSKHVISFYKEVIRYYSDVRRMTNITTEEVRARQLACDILEEELVNRMARSSSSNKEIKNNDYE